MGDGGLETGVPIPPKHLLGLPRFPDQAEIRDIGPGRAGGQPEEQGEHRGEPNDHSGARS